MPTGSRIFWLPRRGNSPAEYEDACAANDAAGRYAVADGATEGCFTDLLGSAAGQGLRPIGPIALPENGPYRFPRPRGSGTPTFAVERSPGTPNLGSSKEPMRPFWGSRSRREQRTESIPFSAVAVGDTCLFHTRDGDMLRAFPLEHSEQFNNAPKLVGARMSLEQIHKKRSVWPDGQGRPGDRLWAITDALAQWCLAESEAGGNPWAELESLLTASEGGDRFASGLTGSANPGGSATTTSLCWRYFCKDSSHGLAYADRLYRSGTEARRLSWKTKSCAVGEVVAYVVGLADALVGQFCRCLQDPLSGHRQHLGLEMFHPPRAGAARALPHIAAHLEQVKLALHGRLPVPGTGHPHHTASGFPALKMDVGGRADAQPSSSRSILSGPKISRCSWTFG